jgi:hypothetical protein
LLAELHWLSSLAKVSRSRESYSASIDDNQDRTSSLSFGYNGGDMTRLVCANNTVSLENDMELIWMISLAVLVLLIAPAVSFAVFKLSPRVRAAIAGICVLGCSICFLKLGEAVAQDKWRAHCRWYYTYPLVQLQELINQAVSTHDTNVLFGVGQKFEAENVSSWGREQLFEKSRFSIFVDEVRSANNAVESTRALLGAGGSP